MDNAIKKFRAAKNVSLAAFGEPFGVNKTSVMRWEERGIPAERVLDVEKRWGISRHDLRPDLYPRERRSA